MSSGWNYEPKEAGVYLKINPDSTVRLRLVTEPYPYQAEFKDGRSREAFGFVVLVKAAPGSNEKESVKVWEIGPSIFRMLKAYLENPVWGDPSQYDIYVTRKGSGLDTEYQIQPDPNKGPITPAQLELIKAADINLKESCLRGGKEHPAGVQAAPASSAASIFEE